MKRTLLAIILACCTLALTAQEAIRVNYKGASPTISDLAWAYLSADNSEDDEEGYFDESFNAVKQAWIQHREGLPLDEEDKLTIDEKNGYVLYEWTSEENKLKIEMCYWNEADRMHKLFAYNVASFIDGRCEAGQYDGLDFYRYDNAKKIMTYCEDRRGTEAVYKYDVRQSYNLPRKGKDITVTLWYDSGKKVKTLKWNGKKFTL